MTKHLTVLLFVGLAFGGCEEKIKYEESGSPDNVMIHKVHNGKKTP